MPIRNVKQQSDRGKIKDLARTIEIGESEVVPSAFELRMKKLFEFAQLTNNKDLQSVLGFITTDYISDKNALPLSAYRIRQVVADIKSKSSEIDKLSQELNGFLNPLETTPEAEAYWKNKLALKKTASKKRKPPFWRASRK
jgi:hypothetical protein